MATLLGVTDAWSHDDSSHPHEARTLRLDVSKASATLGWNPRCDLRSGLSLTANWHRGFEAGLNMREYSEKEIADYAQAR
jgi:CDP-glucose 4,6-dehydratase